MEKVVNLGIPHFGEKLFENIESTQLIKCLDVSRTWKVLAENVLIKRWKGEMKKCKMLEACMSGESKVVQLLLECCNPEEIGLDTKDESGYTPFMLACLYGRKDVVKLLLDYSGPNIDLNERDNYGWTTFMYAC